MLRPVLLFVIFIPIALSLAGAPTPPEANKPVQYYPTQLDTLWEYQHLDEVITERIVEIKETAAGKLVKTERRSDKHDEIGFEKILISDSGLYRAAMGEHIYNPPLCILQLPCKEGKQWKWTTTFLGHQIAGTCIAEIEEEVKTPAGKFTAIHVRMNNLEISDKNQGNWWFSPRIGIIKRQYGVDSPEELKSFTLGKK